MLEQGKLRGWDHHPAVIKIDGRELKLVKEEKGWASWIPDTELGRETFTRQVLCPEGPRAWARAEKQEVLEELQTRIENSAVLVKATMLATRNESKFKISDDITRMECWELVSRVKRKFDARIDAMPSGKVVKKRPIKNFWIDGKVSEP